MRKSYLKNCFYPIHQICHQVPLSKDQAVLEHHLTQPLANPQQKPHHSSLKHHMSCTSDLASLPSDCKQKSTPEQFNSDGTWN